MKLTNKLGLPLPIIEALKNDGYNKGDSDITATSLISPVRIEALKHRYEGEIEEDAANLIYSLQGQSIHAILERIGPFSKLVTVLKSLVKVLSKQSENYLEDFVTWSEVLDDWKEFFKALKKTVLFWKTSPFLVEERFSIQVPMPDGTEWKVSAQIDVFDKTTGVLQDYKLTSVYSVKDGAKEEHVKQMNIQAHILRKNGHTVSKLQVVAILRDWSKGELARDQKLAKERGFKSNYPEQQVLILDVPMVSEDDVDLYILERAIEHKKARSLPESELPECTPEERWARNDTYAVMKKGQKRAIKLFDNNDAASIYLKSLDSGHYVQKRNGESIRCAQYCPVASKCLVAKKNGWYKG